jgi:ABC-type glycerol-3-phosphate transport system substrate-binding protein
VKRLKENSAEIPIALPAGDPFLDRVHIASSWVWGAGGNYLTEDGKNVLLTQPETRAGLKAFFELYRLMPTGQNKLSYEDTLRLFSEGKASVVIADCGFPHATVNENPDFLTRIGVHALPGVPFVSGDNLIIWQVARQSPDKERAALDLVVFLTSRSAQMRFCQSLQQFPVRYDALEAINSPLESLAPVLIETFKNGRTHKPTMLWSRHEQMLGHAFDEITSDVLSKTSMPIESILDIHLPSLQHRFSLLMG